MSVLREDSALEGCGVVESGGCVVAGVVGGPAGGRVQAAECAVQGLFCTGAVRAAVHGAAQSVDVGGDDGQEGAAVTLALRIEETPVRGRLTMTDVDRIATTIRRRDARFTAIGPTAERTAAYPTLSAARTEGLGLAGPAWSTPAAVVGHGVRPREVARDAGLEGLLAKRLTSWYGPGVRSKAWLKIKIHHLSVVVIGGWVPGRGRLNGLPGAVRVGERREGLLRYAGSVGAGWSEAERARLAELLRITAAEHSPFAGFPPVAGTRWVLPGSSAKSATRPAPAPDVCATPPWHRLHPGIAPDYLT